MPSHDPSSVFDALGDATRRQIFALVCERGPITATAVADDLAISRQAVSKHLELLRDAGLTKVERVGREARHELIPGRLDDASAWLDDQATAWHGRIKRLEQELARRAR